MTICPRWIRTTFTCALVIAATALPAMAQSVEIGRNGLEIDESVTDTRTASMQLKIEVSMNGQVMQTVEQTQEELRVGTATVTSRGEDGKVDGMTLEFTKHVTTATQNGIESTTESPVHGKAYSVKKSGDDFTVRNAPDNDGEPGSTEVKEATEAFNLLSTGSHFAAAMPAGAINVGDTVELDTDVLTKAMNLADANGKVDSAKLTLKEVKDVDGRKAAVFSSDLKMSLQPNPGMSLVIVQAGEIILDVKSGTILKTNLSGKLTVSGGQAGPQGQIDIKGGGTNSFVSEGKIKAKAEAEGTGE